jgi:hypothetical protein
MEYASRGVGVGGLTTGVIGTALGAINSGIVGNVLGGAGGARHGGCCNEDHLVNRYEAAKDARIAELETRNKLLESNIYTDQKIADVYERLSGKISCLEGHINQQAVYNATNNATIGCLSQQIAQLQSLTKIVIPKTSVCPEPMDKYNSWTAPTAGA